MERRNIECIPKCLAVSFKRKSNTVKSISGDELFNRFVDINNYCYWNINLKEVFDKCELVGHIQPYCLLISAPDLFIHSLKLAHQKRLLKAPETFFIHFLGDVDSVNCSSSPPSQFVSLDEALCYVIFDLNLRNETSTFDIICCRLAEWYPGMQLPPQFLILATLRNLIEAGQVYYNGYGYNIMTTDKIFIAQWLGEQGPEEKTTDTNSLSDLSGFEKLDLKPRSKDDKIKENKKYFTRPTKSMEKMHFLKNSQSSAAFIPPLEESIKRTKSRSVVKQFFEKLRPRHQKSLLSSLPPDSINIDSIYGDESSYYAFNKSQPIFYSSNLEFSPRYSMTTPNPNKANPKPKWLWRTSLQSLPNNPDNHRGSSSSHSQLSTQVLHDDSPPQAIISRKGHRFKSRSIHDRSKSKRSSKLERSTSRNRNDIYSTKDAIQNDSGVHSMTGSHSKVLPKYPSCSHQFKLLDVESEEKDIEKEKMIVPTMRPKSETRQRLSRSFSTRLTSISGSNSLDPVKEGLKWNTNDDKHVAFKDTFGTAY